MPGPAAFFAGPGAVAAAKHLAYHAATSPTVTSATLTFILFYLGFQKLPDWVKEDISFRNLLKNRKDVSKEELAGLFSVLEKLRNIAGNIQELDTDIPQLHAAMLAFIQLSGQTKIGQVKGEDDDGIGGTANDCDDQSVSYESTTSTTCTTPTMVITRDSLYESAGTALDLSSLRSDEIQNALQMATFAYYEDSKVCSFRSVVV